jgi:hypothetical protein
MASRIPPTGSSEVDAVIEKASMGLERVRNRMGDQGMQGVAFKAQRALRRAKRMTAIGVGGAFTVLIVALIIGLFVPLGFSGIMLTILAMFGVMCLAILFSAEPEVRSDTIVRADLPQLATRTRSWIDQQRPALPAPAATLADDIGRKIAALQPQLATLDANAPEAHELRRLVGEELPHLVEGYKRVPVTMRREERNGRVAERELIDGMKLLDDEIGTLARHIASTDMDKLSSHKRYLELRYKGDDS